MKTLEKVSFWKESALRDVQTAERNYNFGDFHWCLFIAHLAVEKALKARIVSLGKEIPITHNLTKLAKEAEITLTSELIAQFDEITTYNIEARYDDYKQAFYKKANQAYADAWFANCKNIVQFVLEGI